MNPKLHFGSDSVEKLIKEYNKNPLSKDVGKDMLVSKLSTSGQMSDLGFYDNELIKNCHFAKNPKSEQMKYCGKNW